MIAGHKALTSALPGKHRTSLFGLPSVGLVLSTQAWSLPKAEMRHSAAGDECSAFIESARPGASATFPNERAYRRLAKARQDALRRCALTNLAQEGWGSLCNTWCVQIGHAARARQLYVIAAGAPIDNQRCQPIFEAVGQRTFVVGEDPSTANLIKLIGNALGAATMQNLSEAFALARKRGLDPHKPFDVLTGTMYGGRFHRIYGEKIAADEYGSSNFVLPLALKDVRLALNEAELAGAPTPSFSVARDRLIAGIARGYSQLDWSALGLVALEEAGLTVKLPLRAAE